MDEVDHEEVARCLFRESNDALFLIDPDTEKVLDVNPAAQRLTGYRRKEMLGVTLSHLFEADAEHSLEQLRQAFQKTGFFHSAEGFLMRRQDGPPLVVNVSISRIHTRPSPMGLVMVRDISERVRTEEHLRQVQSQLAHVSRLVTVGELATTLAHDINQPLGTIANQAQACLKEIRGGKLATEVIEQTLEEIARDALWAGDIVRRVRRFVAKTSMGETAVDVNCLVEDVSRLMQTEATSQNVCITLQLDADLVPVPCDAVQIQQAIVNLLRNAIEAVAESDDAERDVLVLTKNVGRGVQVSVVDHGPGLSTDAMRQAFEPYFTTKPEGLGLGLNISQSIINQHQGRLWATNSPGGGLTVQFVLPSDASREA